MDNNVLTMTMIENVKYDKITINWTGKLIVYFFYHLMYLNNSL